MVLKLKKVKRRSFSSRVICVFLAISVLNTAIFPTVSFGLTSGPSSPDFANHSQLSTQGMVNEFTGGFNYSIPLFHLPDAEGEGYSMGLTYNADASPKDEATWVGYHWALNPGAITRSKNGFEDDATGLKVKYWNKNEPSVSVGVSLALGLEFSSQKNNTWWQNAGTSVNAGLIWNNQNGFSKTYGVGLSAASQIMAVDYNVSGDEGSWAYSLYPFASLYNVIGKKRYKINESINSEKDDDKIKKLEKQKNRVSSLESVKSIGLNYSSGQYPSLSSEFVNFSVSGTFAAQFEFQPTFNFGVNPSISGSINYTHFTPQQETEYHGFLYSAKVDDDHDVMDYSYENEVAYKKKDKYLGIPISGVDKFIVNGAGVLGAFKAHHKEKGTFRPNKMLSNKFIGSYGRTVNFGSKVGVEKEKEMPKSFHNSLSGSYGYTSIGKMESVTSSSFSEQFENDEVFFRFEGDAGGEISLKNDQIEKAGLPRTSMNVPGFRERKADESQISNKIDLSNSEDIGRSKYVRFTTIKDQNKRFGGDQILGFTKRNEILDFVNRNDNGIQNSIGEYTITNSNGVTYNYGLPVFSRNEGQLTYDIGALDPETSIDNNYLAYKSISEGDDRIKIGHENSNAYASQYLITEILNDNFIDVNNDGPDENDFGGWTKFHYERQHGDNKKNGNSDNWFKWRSPYKGLLTNFGDLSSRKDNTGSANWGEKEIYYLEKVETKTHRARFIKSFRKDGISAADHETASRSRRALGDKQLKKLDQIIVEKKLFNEAGKVSGYEELYTVNFEYDYSLYRGVSNNDGTTDEENPINQGGKLTLKRIWKAYKGVHKAKISPTTFIYNYMNSSDYDQAVKDIDFDSNINNEKVIEHGDQFRDFNEPNLALGTYENPIYDEFNIDSWGNYQFEGSKRYNDFAPGVNQNPNSKFDPAACQLKQIIMPNGGRIQIHYEQNDYSYVQNKLAHLMVPVKTVSGDDGESFVLDLEAVGITSDKEKISVLDAINRHYVTTDDNARKKIYFKFLYSLWGNKTNLTPDQCKSEFIDGYVDLEGAEIEDGEVKIDVFQSRPGFDSYSLPKHICRDFVRKKRGGLINNNDCYGITPLKELDMDFFEGVTYPLSLKEKVKVTKDLFKRGVQVFQFMAQYLQKPSFFGLQSCKAINNQYSYFKIPIATKKLGGGIRVKRILTYDDGIEEGDASLYGTEYDYSEIDIFGRTISTGVASNEPGLIGSENAVASYVGPNNNRKAIGGDEKRNYEGPIGKTFLPSPSIGYSKVISRNIYKGKTHNGISVSEFHTYKDHPFELNPSKIASKLNDKSDGDDSKWDWMMYPLGVVNLKSKKKWLSQGYRFKINSFHGQPKSVKSFGGDPFLTSNSSLTSSIEYEYYEPGEKIPVWTRNNEIEYRYPGKESEVVMASKSFKDYNYSARLSLDPNIAFIGIIFPSISFFPTLNWSRTELHKHVTTKVIHEPVLSKKVTTYTNGVRSSIENLAFSTATGEAIVTKTSDGYNGLEIMSKPHQGLLHNYSIPASYEYQELGQKATNGDYVFENNDDDWQVEKRGAYLVFRHPFKSCLDLKFFPGDKIIINTNKKLNRSFQIGNVEDLNDAKNELQSINTSISNPDFHFDAILPIYYLSNANSEHCSSVSLNAEEVLKISVLESGRRNRLTEKVGDVVTYGNKTKTEFTNPGTYYEFNESFAFKNPLIPDVNCNMLNTPYYWSNVIAASAISLSDKWDYEDDYPGEKVDEQSETHLYCNPFTYGLAGQWRLKDTYVYKADVVSANGVDGTGQAHSYENAGVFLSTSGTPYFEQFNWRKENTHYDYWIKESEITKYDRHGRGLESKNALGIFSGVRFGFNGKVPVSVGENTRSDMFNFLPCEGIEFRKNNSGDNSFLDGQTNLANSNLFELTSNEAHSGNSSLYLNGQNGQFPISDAFEVSKGIEEEGMKVRIWVKISSKESPKRLKGLTIGVEGDLLSNHPLIFIARTGEWSMYEASIKGLELSETIKLNITKSDDFLNEYSGKGVFIDDIKVQPTNSNVVGYVYDYSDGKLLAQFGEQNFGLFYKYNHEGQLTHKVIETSEGTRTISETQYNIPLQNR